MDEFTKRRMMKEALEIVADIMESAEGAELVKPTGASFYAGNRSYEIEKISGGRFVVASYMGRNRPKNQASPMWGRKVFDTIGEMTANYKSWGAEIGQKLEALA